MFDIAINLLKYALIAWLGVLAVCVLRDVVLRGGMGGMLSTPNRRTIDPERVVLLYFTLGYAFYYTLTTLTTPLSELERNEGVIVLPDVPNEVLIALFGAQGSYVIGKILRTLKRSPHNV